MCAVGLDAAKLKAGLSAPGRGYDWLAREGVVRGDAAHVNWFAKSYGLDVSMSFKNVGSPKL